MASDAFAQFVRQSMHVDFSQFIELRKPDGRKPYEKQDDNDITSVAVEVDKQDLLDGLEEFQASPVLEVEDMDSVLALSHAENVSDWVNAIAEYFIVARAGVVSFSELCDEITIPRVEIWLGLLLGNFAVSFCLQFYERLQAKVKILESVKDKPLALAAAYLRASKIGKVWIDRNVPEKLRKAIDNAVANHWDKISA